MFEIALPFRGDAFRVVYAVQLGEDIGGIKTPARDIDLIKNRSIFRPPVWWLLWPWHPTIPMAESCEPIPRNDHRAVRRDDTSAGFWVLSYELGMGETGGTKPVMSSGF